MVLDGRPVGATNVSGEWVWEDGQGDLQIRALGYETLEWEEGCQTSNLELVLQASVVTLGGATVVGGMTPLRLKVSPIRTAVISGTSLAAAHTQDLLESLDFTTGVRESVACGVCGTNSVQLNGMEGCIPWFFWTASPCSGDWLLRMRWTDCPSAWCNKLRSFKGQRARVLAARQLAGSSTWSFLPCMSAMRLQAPGWMGMGGCKCRGVGCLDERKCLGRLAWMASIFSGALTTMATGLRTLQPWKGS